MYRNGMQTVTEVAFYFYTVPWYHIIQSTNNQSSSTGGLCHLEVRNAICGCLQEQRIDLMTKTGAGLFQRIR